MRSSRDSSSAGTVSAGGGTVFPCTTRWMHMAPARFLDRASLARRPSRKGPPDGRPSVNFVGVVKCPLLHARCDLHGAREKQNRPWGPVSGRWWRTEERRGGKESVGKSRAGVSPVHVKQQNKRTMNNNKQN